MRRRRDQSACPIGCIVLDEAVLLGESGIVHTGTFFCDKTTAQSLPRTPTDIIFAAVMALNAYSVHASDRGRLAGARKTKDVVKLFMFRKGTDRLDITALGRRRW